MYMIKLFLRIVKLRFLAKIEYPGAYMAGIIAQWLSYGAEILLTAMMVGTFGALAGWSTLEVVFLYGTWLLTYALAASFTFNICNQMPDMAISGTMDEALTRPVPPLYYLIATNFNVGYLSHITLSIGVMVWSLSQLCAGWGTFKWCYLVVMILSGAAITGCLMLIAELPSMRLRARAPTHDLFFDAREFTKYPIAIYPRPLQMLVTSLLPLGFAGYYPMLALLDKRDGMTGDALIYLAPLVAAVLFVLAGWLWRLTIARYESAGT